MTKSLFLSTTLVAVALVFASSQAVEAQANCTTAVCNAICGQFSSWKQSACNTACPTVGSSAITTGCQSSVPCTAICGQFPSWLQSACNTACTAAGPAITNACKPCLPTPPSEGAL
ncbi:MAG: hypothetical protein HYX35_00325 [Proteobacteria bacterium]|nr:hypothetical protein [Pseudomonadota bacterium]